MPFFSPDKRASTLMTIALMVSSCVMSAPLAAQTFQVLYTFHGSDGASPVAGLTMDGGGRLYGSTYYGGTGGSCGGDGCGTVFQLVHRGTGWILNPLRQFTGGSDGGSPFVSLVLEPNGKLYGTASQGAN